MKKDEIIKAAEEKKIISRSEAKAFGIEYYFTGKPCKYGHIAERKITNYGCVECFNANIERERTRRRVRYHSNRKQERANVKIFREANREKIRVQLRNYRSENPEKFRARQRAQYISDRENIRARQKKYYAANLGKFNALSAKRYANKLRATPSWLTQAQIREIAELYTLAAIKKETIGGNWHVDHIVPLQGEHVCGLHVPWNLQVIPAEENIKKHNKLLDEYMLKAVKENK